MPVGVRMICGRTTPSLPGRARDAFCGTFTRSTSTSLAWRTTQPESTRNTPLRAARRRSGAGQASRWPCRLETTGFSLRRHHDRPPNRNRIEGPIQRVLAKTGTTKALAADTGIGMRELTKITRGTPVPSNGMKVGPFSRPRKNKGHPTGRPVLCVRPLRSGSASRRHCCVQLRAAAGS